MNVVIPMAGRGQRFRDAGFEVPKPLIPLHGKPLYAWSVESLDIGPSDRLIFLARAEDLVERDLEADIRARFAHVETAIVAVDHETAGQAATVLLAEALIDADEPLLIHNADTRFVSDLGDSIAARPEACGMITVFRSTEPRYSFARTGSDGWVEEVAEKRAISDLATVGAYWFARGADFVRHARAMIADDERVGGEFYVIPVYQRMIAGGARVGVDLASEVWGLGTPDELAASADRLAPVAR